MAGKRLDIVALNSSLRSSPRYLTVEHAYKVRPENEGVESAVVSGDVHSKLKPLANGQEKLYSYFAPSLAGGSYHVTSAQTIEAEGKKLLEDPKAKKKFHVQTPQYILPDGAVHSVYPPSGSQAYAETLPHALFTDPYLPWERLATDEGDDRMRMPWLALLTFSQEELQLDQRLLDGNDSLFKNTSLAGNPIQASPTFAINVPIIDLPHISSSLYSAPEANMSATNTNIILIKKKLFNLLTATYDAAGKTSPNQTATDLSRYRYLAHVRHSKAEELEATGDAKGLFGVVFSHRLAPLDEHKKSRAIVHLVSLEAWDNVDRASLSQNKEIDYMVLSSLYSWTYVTVPIDEPGVSASFKRIEDSVSVLRLPDEKLHQAQDRTSNVPKCVLQRLQDGFTLSKYRTQTGEDTIALTRGALIPTMPPKKFGDYWSSLSFDGGNLQIFDRESGLIDISYSMAWNSGKALALDDAAFSTSLSRLRTITDVNAFDKSRKEELKVHETWRSRDDLIKALATSMDTLHKLAHGKPGQPDPTSDTTRLDVPTGISINLSRSGEAVQSRFEQEAGDKIFQLASTSDKKGKEQGEKLFNELNTPNATDWMVVLSWIMDRLFLFEIPAQHLIIEPSFLPDESLRFFYIDPHWMDALIDGALSIANHISQNDDEFRCIVKSAMNTFFGTVDPETRQRPQIPTYGFLLRSHLVKDFTDLHVTAPLRRDLDPAKPDTSTTDPTKPGIAEMEVKYKPHRRAPVLRQEKLAEDTLLCLFDRAPDESEPRTLSFTQPPHQQYFVVGDQISTVELQRAYKRTYTKTPKDGIWDYDTLGPRTYSSKPDGSNCIFIWGEDNEARFLNLTGFIEEIKNALEQDEGTFDNPIIGAGVIGYQLGSRIHQLKLISQDSLKKPSNLSPSTLASTEEELRWFKRSNARAFATTSIPMSQDTGNVAALHPTNFLQAQDSELATVNSAQTVTPIILRNPNDATEEQTFPKRATIDLNKPFET